MTKITIRSKTHPFGEEVSKTATSGDTPGPYFDLCLDPHLTLEENLRKVIKEINAGHERGAELHALSEQMSSRQAASFSRLIDDSKLPIEIRKKYAELFARMK